MGYVNPHYDPEWEKVHDHHAAERARLAKERDHLIATDGMTSDAYKRVEADYNRHHQACLASFKMQHATVQDYATWLFGEFDVSMGDHGAGIPIPQVDFEQLRTAEDADAAWSRVHRAVTASADEKLNSLPVGQPEGLKAFADATSPSIARYWREFSARDLYPQRYAEDSGTRMLMTVDEQDDGWHVCFVQDWNSVGVSVTNAVERLATAVYREACAIAKQQAPKTRGIRAWFERQTVARAQPPRPDPAQFHFYQHIPPYGLHVSEQFDRVDLNFRNGEYHEPKWISYCVVPKLIQSARLDCAQDASQTNARPRDIAISDQRAPTL